jgi:hypothetical protein
MSTKRKARPPVVRKVSSGNSSTPMTPEDERQLEDDRAWFKARPGVNRRLRPSFNFGGYLARPPKLVLVRQVAPGLRLRTPLPSYTDTDPDAPQ